MTLTLVQKAQQEPVSLAEVKDHLKIDWTDEDADLGIKLTAARRYVELTALRGRALVTSQWKLGLDCWCGAVTQRDCCCGAVRFGIAWLGLQSYEAGRSYIELPLGNLQAVGAVTYRTPDQTVFPFTDFKLSRTYDPNSGDLDAGIGRLCLAYGKYWPTAILDVAEPISIPFTAGWKDGASVPSQLKLAIMMLVAHWYRNREAVTVGNRVTTIPGSTEAVPMISTPLALAVDSLCAEFVDRRF
jgi:hypothetical protein